MAVKNIAIGLLLATLGIAAALGVVELSLRLGPVDDANGLRGLHEARPDKKWLYGLRPGAAIELEEPVPVRYVVNEDGYRGPVVARPKPEGVFRILVLGDSVTFGYGVAEDETYVAVMEQKLRELVPESKPEVVNLGVGGYNTFNEFLLYGDVGVTFEPDVVVTQFCINDISPPTLHFDGNTRLALGEISDDFFPIPRDRPVLLVPPAWCAPWQLCQRAWRYWKRDELGAQFVQAFRPAEGARQGEAWDWMFRRMVQIKRAAERRDAGFVLASFPYQKQMDPETRSTRQQRRMSILKKRYRVKIAGIYTPFLAAKENGIGPLFQDMWHPTPEGHRIAADAILQTLACEGLLPEGARSLCPPEPKKKRRRRSRR